MAIPVHLQGVWSRSLLTAPDGTHDDTTEVFWLQTASLFGDLRVPAGLHDNISVGLNSCTPQQLLALAEQRASVGGISLQEGGQCQWHSDLEYQPLGGPPDIGKLDLQSPTKIKESGVLTDYEEIWDRLPASTGDQAAFRLKDRTERTGALLVSGDYFMFAADRQQPLASTGVALREAVQQLQPDAQRGALMYEMSFGSVAGGSMAWDITHSTLPGRRGQHLLAEDVSLQDLRNLAASGSKLNAGKYCSDAGWDIIEASDPAQLGPAE